MAVQKSKRTPRTRGNRRAHDKLKGAALSTDSTTGEIHLRHNVGADDGKAAVTGPDSDGRRLAERQRIEQLEIGVATAPLAVAVRTVGVQIRAGSPVQRF